MKKTITLLFGLFFGLNLFGQYVNYETDSRWFLNANVGGTWQTTDVENKTYAGWGLILGKSFNYNYGKLFRWDLRGRYLGGKWYGQDYDSTGLSNEYTGVYDPYKDSLGFAVQNFESENHELGLELAVHLNRLREKTGVDLYAFGGANIVWNRTNGDIFNQDTLLGFNNIYNYDAIGLNENSIDAALDGIYDTPLDGHTQQYRANFMPSLGFGIGYYFTPHFSVGLEHKTTFTLRDDWDGFESDAPQGKSELLNDIYHYTSGYLRFHFRQGRTRPTNPNTNTTNNNLVGGGGCQDPVIAFIQPNQATTDVTVSESQFKVKVSHVAGRENITLRVNGNVTTNFLYNAQSDVLESYLVLAPGMNTIQVTAGNGCGSVSQNYTINYINCIAPEISFTAPSHTNFHASQNQFDIRADIERASNVKFKVNGISTTSFYYNIASGSFQSSVTLQPGQNVFELVATNECGTDTETVTVSLSDCNDPSIVFLNSNSHVVTTDVQQFTFKAQVLNVEGRGNIGFRINGVNKQFTFDPDSKYMNSGFSLQEGTNTIQVTAANDCGTETETFTVEYTPCVAPFIQMIDPTGQALQTTAANYIVKAKLFNVASLTQVQLTVNGALVSGGQLNPTTKVYQKQVNLQMGENVIKLAVTTDCGTDIEVTKVTRVREQSDEKITICHRPPGNPGNAQTIEIPLSAWPAHQAHGDVLGPCPEIEEPSNEKITICHRPPGNPGNAQTIEIPLSAWPAHQAHGDVLGPCPIEEDHGDEKITICHRPPGNPGNGQTIEIPLSAWPAHQAHGDVLGPCPQEPNNPGNGTPGGNEKITICHYPPGNNGNPQTIEIPLSAWPAHQAHGDVMGPCPEEPANPGSGTPGGNEKITICHYPPGNNGNPQTIEIPLSAWPAHQAHGDKLGACPEEPNNSGSGTPGGNEKITICHYPPGNNGNPQTIEIPLSAWPAHQAHGDKLGPCPEEPGGVGNNNNPNNPGGQIGNPIGSENGEASGKITICHYPPGNTDNPQTIEIPMSAWPAHKAHGDKLGPCPDEPNNPGNNGNQGDNNENSQGTNTNTQGGSGSTGTIGGSGTGSTGTVTGSGTTGTIGGSGTGSTGTVTGSGTTNTGGTNTQGGSGTGNTNGNNGSSGGNGNGGGDEGGGNKSNTGTSGGKGSGGDNFNAQSAEQIKAAEEAAKKKAAEAAAKKKAAEEAAKKKAAEEAAKKKAAEEAAKKRAAEAAAKKKAAEAAAKKKAAEEAAKKQAAEEAAKKKAAEEAAKKKAAEAAAKKKAAKKQAAEEAAKKKAAEEAAKKKAAEEAAKKKAEEGEKQKKEEDKPKRP